MLSDAQLCKKLGIAPKRLKELLRSGLPHAGRGRKRQYNPEQVAAWLTENGLAEQTAEVDGDTILRTRAECANHFGIRERQVSEWQLREGFPGKPATPGYRDGYYPVKRIEAWRAQHFGPRASDTTPLSEALLRIKRAEAEAKELRNLERRGKLLERDDVLQSANELVLRLKSRLDALPEEFEQLIPREHRAALKAEMVEWVRQRQLELAAWEPATK